MSVTRLIARVKNLEIISARLIEALLNGHYRSVFRGPGLEFSEVRAYTDGDDPRTIDWNVSARTNSLHTKTFREERELSLFVLVDLSASMFTGRGDQTQRETVDLLFTAFALAAINNNDRVGAGFFTDQIEFWRLPTKGRTHALSLIQDLLDFKPKGQGSDLALALRTVGEALKHRGICVILSDFKTSAYRKELGTLARHHDVIAIRLVSAEDLDFPNVGLLHLQDPETGTALTAFGQSSTFRRHYREYWSHERRQWFHDCRTLGVSAMEISAGDDPFLKLFQFFQRRKHRRAR
jgi:uncharacterized protein (DUF58 family)